MLFLYEATANYLYRRIVIYIMYSHMLYYIRSHVLYYSDVCTVTHTPIVEVVGEEGENSRGKTEGKMP